MNPELSVIIPSFNPGPKILRCIEALQTQQVEVPFEIIVADSSQDGSESMLQGLAGIKLVRSPARLFPGSARNMGAGAASGRILCFIDADCLPCDDWLQSIWEARPDIEDKVVGGAALNGTPSSGIGSAEYFSEISGMLPGRPKRDVDFLPGANFSLGAEAFRRVGGFRDYEKGSDVTFGSDCRSSGIQPEFHPGIKVAHCNRTRLRGFLRNQEKLGWGAGNNRVLFELEGSWLAHHRWTWPLVPLVRFTRVIYRSARDGAGQRGQLLRAAPWILLGSGYFGVGFARGARDGMRARGEGQV